MGFNVTPEQVAAFEAARKAKAAENEREWNEAQKQRQTQQAYIKAKVQATRLAEIKTANEELTCELCHKPIPDGTRYRLQKTPIGYGFPEGTKYAFRKTHLICNVQKCPKFEECGNSTSGLCNNEYGRESYRECGVYKKKTEAQA